MDRRTTKLFLNSCIQKVAEKGQELLKAGIDENESTWAHTVRIGDLERSQ